MHDNNPENAVLLDLRAEVEQYNEENSRLVQDIRKKRKDQRSMDLTVQNGAELLVEQQCQLCEDLQAELAEAVERSRALEEQCCSLEEQLLCSNEEAELEQFRALEALRSKSKACEDRLVEQVQGLQRQMQEMQLQRLQSRGSAETGSSAAVATPGGNQQTTTESSVPISGNLTGGHRQ